MFERSVAQITANVKVLREQIPSLDAELKKARAGDAEARREVARLLAEASRLASLDLTDLTVEEIEAADARRPALAAEIKAARQRAAQAEDVFLACVKRREQQDALIEKERGRLRSTKLEVVALRKQIARAEKSLDQTALPRDQRGDALKLKVERLSKEGGLRDMRARLAHLSQGA